jgi:hypothetical protein
MNFMFNYELPEGIGNLQFQLVPGLGTDGRQLVQLSLTAFGKPKGSGLVDIVNWLDQGRRAVVQGFSDFTSEEVQAKVWERIWH